MGIQAPAPTTQQRFNLIQEHLDAIYEKMKEGGDRIQALESGLQTEGTARVRAENLISLIAHSTTGNYDWCREVCMEYLNH